MGIGGALMWPAILGMTYAMLPEEKAGLAGGIIIGAAGLGNAIGPLIGGVLTDALSWRWIFFLNVPISIFAVARHLLPGPRRGARERRPADRLRRDRGALGRPGLAAGRARPGRRLGLGRPAGDRPAGARRGAARRLRPDRAPRRDATRWCPREVMRNESFRASCVAILFMSATFFAALLYLPQFMQKQLGYSPLEAGVGMLPFLATFAARLLRRRARSTTGSGRSCWPCSAPPASPSRRSSSRWSTRLGLRLADRRHGRARDRDRQLLPDRDHRRRHLGRRIADQPRRRHRLHVPDRRRLDRAGPDDDGLLGRRSRPSSTASRPPSGSTRRSRWSAS